MQNLKKKPFWPAAKTLFRIMGLYAAWNGWKIRQNWKTLDDVFGFDQHSMLILSAYGTHCCPERRVENEDSMLLYYFYFNKTNYARYETYYV